MNFADLPEMRAPHSFKSKVVVFGLIAMAVAVGSVACKRIPTATAEQHLQIAAVNQSASLMPLTVTPVADELIIEETPVTQPDARASAKTNVARKENSYLTQRVVIHHSIGRHGEVTSIKARPVTVTM